MQHFTFRSSFLTIFSAKNRGKRIQNQDQNPADRLNQFRAKPVPKDVQNQCWKLKLRVGKIKNNVEFPLPVWYIKLKEGHLRQQVPLMEPTPKGGVSQAWSLPLSERRPSCLRQGGHYFFRLWSLSLSRKASNATIKLPKDISKANIPMKIETIS